MIEPIVIIGAPRSGTNMLRNVICALDGVATWPCDEINYIWRHGNLRYPSDEIPVERVSIPTQSYIRMQFGWVAKRYKAHTVVEKTCANSLRVPFVDAVLPEAKFIFIRRNGLDAVGSAMKRWKAQMDIPYLMRKARFVPLSDLPYYGSRYLWNRMYRLISQEERLAFWGPKLKGMDELLAKHSLDEVCAFQWQACVDKAADALMALPQERWIEVSYEEFVQQPEHELTRVLDFIGLDVKVEDVKQAVMGVRAGSVGKGRAALDDSSLSRLEALVKPTLNRFGYS